MQTFTELMAVNEKIHHISAREAKKKWGQPGVVFIDVRDKDAFAAQHIEGAKHMERGMLEFYLAAGSPLENKAFAQQDHTEIIVYCNRGGQSALATKTMQDMGLKNVVNLDGGITAWHEVASGE